MKKSFNKGFVMAEMIVVSIVVVTALILIYTQFITINNAYYRSFNYNTVDDLYALNNVKEFLLNDNFDKIISQMYGKNYIDLTSCSTDYFIEYNYCETLLNTLNISSLIITFEDVTNLKEELKNNILTEGMNTFIKTINSNKNNKYRIIAEFENNRYATLKLGSFMVSNISNECVKANNKCDSNSIKSGISLDLSVNDNETYKFYVLKDDGDILTLIMDEYLSNNKWSNSINNGPDNVMDYLINSTKNWTNVTDITLNLNGINSNNYNGCQTYNSCQSNIYTINSFNSKARLPMVQELADLGCTTTAGSCPSWLNNLSSQDIGYWTSSVNTNVWYVSYDNRLNTTSSTNSLKIKPVIVLDKNKIKG